MSNERQPLLTEEQIQEMSKIPPHFLRSYLEEKYSNAYWGCVKGRVYIHFKNPIFLAFLRGKTKRILNLDRLFQIIKKWAADPNKKYPEWMSDEDRGNINEDWIVKSKLDDWMEYKNSLQYEICSFASIIGINPDDYFEEVEVTE